jgi:hypothetical protein
VKESAAGQITDEYVDEDENSDYSDKKSQHYSDEKSQSSQPRLEHSPSSDSQVEYEQDFE